MQTPYVTYNNEIGVRLSFLLSDENKKMTDSICAFSYSAYEKKAIRSANFRLRQGKGNGNEVLIRWTELYQYHEQLIAKFGNPKTEHNPMEEYFAIDGKARIFFETHKQEDGTNLKPEQISQYTLNASVLNTLHSLFLNRKANRKQRNNSTRGVFASCVNDCNNFNEVLKLKYSGAQHTLPKNERRLSEALKQYLNESYNYLIDKRAKNQNAAKVKTEVHMAMLEQLLRKHNNYDNEQIAFFYNIAAEQLGWKDITGATVANYRKELGLYVYAGAQGETKFRNTKSMQIRRSAPTTSMAYWTLDGWDAELLYQKTETDQNGRNRVTFHNRLTVVVVLDPVAGIKYPIGYAIGTHETPELIQEAMRNAANHTKELFGSRYKPLQLQSDHYALGKLTSLYEAMSKHFTPARVKNAKSKVIEPYFLSLNKKCQLYFKNWSGFGVTSLKENQPNTDYLNKIRHTFPDEQGCRQQIARIIEMERLSKRDEYIERFERLPEQDRLPLENSEYLYLFGETHQYTNRLQPSGLNVTLLGETISFDSFDPKFRELGFVDWAVKYDPQDLSSVLVLNARTDSATRKLKEIVGTHRFELTSKYVQPMALYDRQEGDSTELAKVGAYNQQLEQSIIERGDRTYKLVEKTMLENPQLNDTLTKMVLIDSNGQHKDNKSTKRLNQQPKQRVLNVSAKPVQEEDYEILDEDHRNEYGLTD